ncbi:MAG: GNAT family N-acetyltransferase [Methanosarcina sp.]
MPENVRLIKFEELDQLLDLYKQLNPEDPDIRGLNHVAELWKEILNDPNLYYLVVEEDGRLVSSCTLTIIKSLTRGGRPFGLREYMVTDSAYRKKGYGTAILHKAAEIAKEKNCYKLMLLTGRKEESTLRFYENAGFVRGIKTGFIKYL